MTRRRNNDIPGQCSESRERMAERQTKHNTQPEDKRERNKERRTKKQRGGKRRDRESGD